MAYPVRELKEHQQLTGICIRLGQIAPFIRPERARPGGALFGPGSSPVRPAGTRPPATGRWDATSLL
jgi:hypothetical protein